MLTIIKQVRRIPENKQLASCDYIGVSPGEFSRVKNYFCPLCTALNRPWGGV